jgi:hypothetical protein
MAADKSAYGCHNRAPLRSHQAVQAGWKIIEVGPDFWARVPIMKLIEVPMSKDCQHTLGAPDDPGCAGCGWQWEQA